MVEQQALHIKKISLHIQSKSILCNVNLKAPTQGEVIGLLGPNGAGKSSLLRCITGFERSYHGSVTLHGRPLEDLAPCGRTQQGIGYLPQESWLFSDMSVKENLIIVAQFLNKKKQKIEELSNHAMEEMGLVELKNSKAKVLSGGEKRRLEFARTLLLNPKILLLDEPFAGVDPKTILEILRIVKSLSKRGISILISDHHAEHIFNIASTIHLMHQGRILETGDPDTIRKSPMAKSIYLGEA